MFRSEFYIIISVGARVSRSSSSFHKRIFGARLSVTGSLHGSCLCLWGSRLSVVTLWEFSFEKNNVETRQNAFFHHFRCVLE
jgi:hypothetical protein